MRRQFRADSARCLRNCNEDEPCRSGARRSRHKCVSRSFVGFRQRAFEDIAGQSEVIEFLLMHPKVTNNNEVAQAASLVQLGDRHRVVLLRAAEKMDFAIALVAIQATIEWAAWNNIHDLLKASDP